MKIIVNIISSSLVSISSSFFPVPPSIVERLDESIRNEFAALRGEYFFWLLFCTAAVAIGVLLEEAEAVSTWRIPTLGTHKSFFKCIAIIGWMLIIFGVIGEGLCEALVSKADGLIATFNETLLSNTEREAQFANTESSTANERAAELETKAANLTASNLRLEAAIAPRRLSKRQLDGFAAITTRAGRVVQVKSYSSDTESLVLATQLVDALKKAHLTIVDNRLTMVPVGSVIFGVSVEGADADLVADLKKLLSLDGSLMAVSPIPTENRGSISMGAVSTPRVTPAATITVGAKPIK